MIGQLIGSYRVVRMLGMGGMGAVYLARHELIGQLVAVKVLRNEYSTNPEMFARIFNEARLTALIKHPGLVDVYDFGRLADGSAYIIMEYLEGESLATRMARERRLPIELAVALARQIAVAVGAAHQKGIVHRDLKPDNVFLVADEELACGVRARILDFGIAKLSGDLADGSMRTRTGSILGTPVYMSPEQCRGAGTVDWRSDIYSLGCILFEMVTGEHLFPIEGMGEIIAAHLHAPPRRASAVSRLVPPWLDEVIVRMLAKSPLERPQSMDEVALALGARPRSLPGVPTDAATRVTPQTTTHNQAGEVSQPYATVPPAARRSRAGLVAALAALGVAALVAVAVMMTREPAPPLPAPVVAAAAPAPERAPPPTATPGPPPSPEPSPQPTPSPEPPPSPPPQPQPAPAPAPAAAPERRVTLAIASDPPGATVVDTASGARLGTTPLRHVVPAGATPLALEVRLDGHATARLRLVPDEDRESTVTLRRRAPRPAASKPEKGGERETLDPFAN